MKNIKGNTTEEKLNHLDKIIGKLARRSSRKTSGIVAPFPISDYCPAIPADGSALRYLFPADGRITRTCISLDKFPKEPVEITAWLRNSSGISSKNFQVNKGVLVVDVDVPVKAGDRLSVEVAGQDVEGIWIGLLWAPANDEVRIEERLIDELEKMAGLEA